MAPGNFRRAMGVFRSRQRARPGVLPWATHRLLRARSGKDEAMSHWMLKDAIALGLAGTLVIGAGSMAATAPMPSITGAVKSAVPTHVTGARWRGGDPFVGGF